MKQDRQCYSHFTEGNCETQGSDAFVSRTQLINGKAKIEPRLLLYEVGGISLNIMLSTSRMMAQEISG